MYLDILKIWYISKLWESFIFDFHEFNIHYSTRMSGLFTGVKIFDFSK